MIAASCGTRVQPQGARGNRGSKSGFQLDYHKVSEWMRPKPYCKARMVKGAEKSVDRGTRERHETFESFFVEENRRMSRISSGARLRIDL